MKKDKGFSLVELIIVIAIMAILVGVMAPQLIKYIEKTNISSDIQLCDTVATAITTAMSDPDVISNPTAALQISGLTDAGAEHRLDGFADTAFTDAVNDIVGVDIFDLNEQHKLMRSKPAKSSGILVIYGVGNGVIVYISHSDATGAGRDINPHGVDPRTTDAIHN